MSEKDGGPAYPTLWQPEVRDPDTEDVLQRAEWADPGMSLRDYFAATALPHALVAGEQFSYAEIAAEAYTIADAMLKAREK